MENVVFIEDNVPIPTDAVNPTRKRKYPFDNLQPEQSFYVEGKTRNQLSASALLAEHRTGFKFIMINSPTGVRVWRSEEE